MVLVTIRTSQGTVRAKFMTGAVLSTITPIFPLQHSISGVRVVEELEYYCNQHRASAPAQAVEITLDEARREVAWCKECKTVLYLNPDDREWETLRDRLCPNRDYSQIEIYKSVERDTPTHSLISFHRLVPGALKVEVMFPSGAFDYKDAFRDRREEWPNAIYVDDAPFDRELAKRATLAAGSRQCCAYIDAGQQGWHLCGAPMGTTCYQCQRPICETHQENFTYYGDKGDLRVTYFTSLGSPNWQTLSAQTG
jgi:hypothetical protein